MNRVARTHKLGLSEAAKGLISKLIELFQESRAHGLRKSGYMCC